MIRRKKVKLWDLDCNDPVASKASLGWGVGWGGGLFLQRVRLVQCPHSNPVAFSDMTQGHADKHRNSSKSGEWNIVLHWIFPFWLEWSLSPASRDRIQFSYSFSPQLEWKNWSHCSDGKKHLAAPTEPAVCADRHGGSFHPFSLWEELHSTETDDF